LIIRLKLILPLKFKYTEVGHLDQKQSIHVAEDRLREALEMHERCWIQIAVKRLLRGRGVAVEHI
jgi:hypothetical protein